MQFNSYIFILCFLPCALCGYFLLNRLSFRLGALFLLAMSLWFYSTAGWRALLLLCLSMAGNYGLSLLIQRRRKKPLLILGIVLNAGLLFFYKYLGFTLENLGLLLGREFELRALILPLGISFYSFQQIAYLVDSYRGETEGNKPLEYALYILLFPKLLMGPLASQKDIIAQLRDGSVKTPDAENISVGLRMFAAGLFKKLVLADAFARVVNLDFASILQSSAADVMLISLAYTFQIYFDFSGYSDMATGAARALNIRLPINFNSPYKALSIRDFWKRWHISLTRFLTDYIYKPLGGSRRGERRTAVNVMAIFLISGIWHGANWTFIVWGLLHGLCSVLERRFQKQYSRIPAALRWLMTFAAVDLLWLLFRCDSVPDWLRLLKHMALLQNMTVSPALLGSFSVPGLELLGLSLPLWLPALLLFTAAFVICLVPENNYRREYRPGAVSALLTAAAICWCLISLGSESVFIYNNF